MICFDYDETLVSTIKRQFTVFSEIISQEKYNRPTMNEFCQLRNQGVCILDILTDHCSIPKDKATILQNLWVSKIEEIRYQQLDTPTKNAKKMMNLAKSNSQIAIVSARQNHEFLCNSAKKLFAIPANQIFSVNPLQKDVTCEKSKILKKLNASGFVGDSNTDKRAAFLANIQFFDVKDANQNDFHKWFTQLVII